MDLEIIILNEVKSDTEKQIPYITYPWNIKKKRYKRTYLQNRNRVTGVENIGDKVREDKLGDGGLYNNTTIYKIDN